MSKKEMKALRKMDNKKLAWLLKDTRLSLMKLKIVGSGEAAQNERIRKRRLRRRIARILGEFNRRGAIHYDTY